MEIVLTWIGAALAVLLFVAIVVAVAEHYALLSSRFQEWPAQPPSDHAPLQLAVDVHVDEFAHPPVAVASGDGAERRATLEQAIVKLAQPPTPRPAPAPRPARSWVDTEPMVGLALQPSAPPAGPARTS